MPRRQRTMFLRNQSFLKTKSHCPRNSKLKSRTRARRSKPLASLWPTSPYVRPYCARLYASCGPTMRSWLIL